MSADGGTRVTRRRFLGGAAGTGALALVGWPGPVASQSLRKIKYTNPWLPVGTFVFSYVARRNGFWKRRGLDVEVARGYGSVAAAQAIGLGQFDFGSADSSVITMQQAKGLPLIMIGQLEYMATQGIGILADSPIKKPKDLEGKTLGGTPASGEFPFLGAYAKAAGFDLGKVKVVHIDAQVRDRSLVDKAVDAISAYASAMIPPLKSRGVDTRFMLFTSAGMKMYSLAFATQRQRLKDDSGVVEAFIDGAHEAVVWTINHPEQALEVFLSELKELGMTSSGRDFTKLGLGIHTYCSLVDEVKKHGFGWVDPKVMEAQTDLVMEHIVKGDGKRPAPEESYTNRFTGRYRFSEAEWARALKGTAEWPKILT